MITLALFGLGLFLLGYGIDVLRGQREAVRARVVLGVASVVAGVLLDALMIGVWFKFSPWF